jgi:hypothetical protein
MLNTNKRGQFFSQDIVVATLIFIFSIMLFLVGSQAVYSQVTLADARNKFDGSIHSTLESLISTPGEPVGWEFGSLEDVNSFGLVKTKNVLDGKKVEQFMYYLDNNYDSVKLQLGASNFDLNLVLMDSNGEIIFSSGNEIENPLTKLIYERIVFYDGEQAVLKGVITVE